MNLRELLKLTGLPVLFASLCCLSPVILVVLGLSSVSFAASLADTLYGTYKWVFRSVGLLLLFLTVFLYLRRKNICTIDAVSRNRNRVINIVLLSLVVSVLGYIFFLYVVVHYVGVWLGLW